MVPMLLPLSVHRRKFKLLIEIPLFGNLKNHRLCRWQSHLQACQCAICQNPFLSMFFQTRSKIFHFILSTLNNESHVPVFKYAFLIDRSSFSSKDFIVMLHHSFDKIVDVTLELHLVTVWWNGEKCWTKTDAQVVGIHHILITVF